MNRYIDPAAKLLMHLDRIVDINAGKHPAPVNVEIDLTNRCNLGCDDCHFAHVHTRGPLAKRRTHDSGDEFAYPLIDNVLQQLAAAGVRSITWTGGGEPTLHRFFDAVIDDCPLPQGLYTNGTQIDEIRADLLRRRCEWVYVSMDCHTRESYKAYKKADAFERACQGVRNLADAQGRATVGVGYLIHGENWLDIPAMIQHGLNLGAHYVNFRPIINFDPALQSRPAGGLEWIDAARPTLERAAQMDKVIVDVERFAMLRNWHGHPYKLCQWAQLQTVITPDARVWTCVNRRGVNGDALGDLSQEPFAEIWKRSRAYPVTSQCRVMCRGHIPNVALNEINQQRAHGQFI